MYKKKYRVGVILTLLNRITSKGSLRDWCTSVPFDQLRINSQGTIKRIAEVEYIKKSSSAKCKGG